jgi:hypothetical protein
LAKNDNLGHSVINTALYPILSLLSSEEKSPQRLHQQGYRGHFYCGIYRHSSKKGRKNASNFSEKEEDVTWMPPEDQKRDGRTALNDKFGY